MVLFTKITFSSNTQFLTLDDIPNELIINIVAYNPLLMLTSTRYFSFITDHDQTICKTIQNLLEKSDHTSFTKQETSLALHYFSMILATQDTNLKYKNDFLIKENIRLSKNKTLIKQLNSITQTQRRNIVAPYITYTNTDKQVSMYHCDFIFDCINNDFNAKKLYFFLSITNETIERPAHHKNYFTYDTNYMFLSSINIPQIKLALQDNDYRSNGSLYQLNTITTNKLTERNCFDSLSSLFYIITKENANTTARDLIKILITQASRINKITGITQPSLLLKF